MSWLSFSISNASYAREDQESRHSLGLLMITPTRLHMWLWSVAFQAFGSSVWSQNWKAPQPNTTLKLLKYFPHYLPNVLYEFWKGPVAQKLVACYLKNKGIAGLRAIFPFFLGPTAIYRCPEGPKTLGFCLFRFFWLPCSTGIFLLWPWCHGRIARGDWKC